MSKRVYFNIFFWIIITGINFGFSYHVFPLKVSFQITAFVLFFQALVFYFNSYVLFPRYFSLKDNGRFFLVTILFVILVTFLQSVVDYYYFSKFVIEPILKHQPRLLMIFMRSVFWLIFIDMLSTVFLMQDRIREQAEHTQQIKSEKLATELKLLKAQINPHFIFNALNNVYSLAYLKSDKAPESILKLSQMLRYVIEDCQQEKVALKSEIEYIENYIAFQQMKSPEDQNISFDYSNAAPKALIAPMLFIPFIENSFKYSKIEEFPDAFIQIKLASENGDILFQIQNSIPISGKHKPGAGTGIENVKQRLEIIYPENHLLQIQEEKNEFKVSLRFSGKLI